MSEQIIDIDKAFGPAGLLARKLPGYRERTQQVELAERIEQAFDLGTTLLAEAPTGVGKSIAALVPSMQKIKEENARVLVVTSSILLQGQYMEKDIPFLEDVFDLETNAVLIKGKQNYVCMRKMNTQTERGNVHPRNDGQWQRIKDWAELTKTGEFSELDFRPAQDVRKATAILHGDECKKRTCAFADSCFYYKNKSKLQEAKLVVCNYHYLFTTLEQSDFATMLGGDFDYVVYDEAHEIVSIARDFLEKRVSRQSLDRSYAHLVTLSNTVGGPGTDLLNKSKYMDVMGNINNVFDGIYRSFVQTKDRYKDTMLYDEQGFITGSINDLVNWYMTLQNDIIDLMSLYVPETDERQYLTDEEKAWCTAAEDYSAVVGEALSTVRSIQARPEGWITWVEFATRTTKDDDVRYIHKPHDVSDLLGKMFDSFDAAICMSATMLVGDSLDYFAGKLGVTENRDDLVVETPFALNENLLWYLPADCPDGNNHRDHAGFVIPEMHRIASELKGRTLCLFTSNKNMRLAMDHFKEHPIPGVKVLSQDDYQKERIVEMMRNDPHIVVLSTKSFFTGVDIPGSNLSAVLIDKIPFPMIGDPINDYLSNRQNGFFRYMLPEAIITLKQAVGRLNRTEDDRGVVAVFDGRLGNKPYRARIFNSFRHKIQGARDFKAIQDYFGGAFK